MEAYRSKPGTNLESIECGATGFLNRPQAICQLPVSVKRIALFIPLATAAFAIAASNSKSPSYDKLVICEGVYTEGASFGDVNGDGKTDLGVGNKKGVFIFTSAPRKK